MKTQVIIPAAGTGTRLKSGAGAPGKPLIPLNGKPLLVYSLEIFEKCPLVESIIVVLNEKNIAGFDKMVSQYHLTKVSSVIAGGPTRRESVSNGLKELDEDTKLVVIHDGARPLVSPEVVKKAITLCYDESAVVVGVPVKPTIKRVHPQNMNVEATLDRRLLWEVQTPQVFKRDILVKAHKEIKDTQATDDAVLVEALGKKVKMVEGEYRNIKITTAEDLLTADAFLKEICKK